MLDHLIARLAPWVPEVLALIASGLSLWLAGRVLLGRPAYTSGQRLLSYLLMTALFGACLVLVILATPVSDATHGQLLGFFGILISGAIALSATTLLGNVMAGVMLRAVGSFRAGDFLRVEDHFGRVTELGLLHTEIQTEDRDLTTLPNLFMVQRPFRVVQNCGTVVSATVSLGYDVSRRTIEEALLEAVEAAGLRGGFVRVLELGDFSVLYRAAGFLEDSKVLLTSRSQLRGAMIDALHGRDIEIVSPTFMNQRVFATDQTFLHYDWRPQRDTGLALTPESRIFDKADAAESREQLVETLKEIDLRLAELEKQKAEVTAVEIQRQIGREVRRLQDLRAQLEGALEPEPPEGEALPSGDAPAP